MIKNFNELTSKELSQLKRIMLKDENNNDYNYSASIRLYKFIIDNDNISIIYAESSPFDFKGTIIWVISGKITQSIIKQLEKQYDNIYFESSCSFDIDFIEERHIGLFRTVNNNQNTDYPIPVFLTNKINNIYKPFEQFVIDNFPVINTNFIRYSVLNSNEFTQFLENNYVVNSTHMSWSVRGISALLGFEYTSYNGPTHNCNFLISTIPNNLKKETLLGIIKYNHSSTLVPFDATYIAYVETNYYYRRNGIFKSMANNLASIIPIQPLIISRESRMGEVVSTANIIKKAIEKKGLPIPVFSENEIEKLEKYTQSIKR